MSQSPPSLNPLVRKLDRFAPLSKADRLVLEGISAPIETAAAQSDLVREGDTPRGILLVLEGMAYRYKMRANGARQIVAYLVPGDMGDVDVALLDRMDHSIGTFSAWIKPSALADVRSAHPAIADAMRISTLVDEATLREWLLNVGGRSSIERLAHLFSELLHRLQVVGLVAENSYALPISQAELAYTTGMSQVHVNRVLMELRRRGLIELRSRSLTILNRRELERLAEFKANYLHLDERRSA
jgi:CRP-like cAMP-binding protein